MESILIIYTLVSLAIFVWFIASINAIKNDVWRQVQTQTAQFKLISLIATKLDCDAVEIEKIRSDLADDLK